MYHLQRMELVDYGTSEQPVPVRGVTDFFLRQNNEVKMIVEFKATHSLALPMTATEVADLYFAGRVSGDGHNSLAAKNVCPPLGQLMASRLPSPHNFDSLTWLFQSRSLFSICPYKK